MAIASSSCDQAVSTSRRLDDHVFSSLSLLTLVFCSHRLSRSLLLLFYLTRVFPPSENTARENLSPSRSLASANRAEHPAEKYAR